MSFVTVKAIHMKEPLVVLKGQPHPIKEVERQFGGLWICRTVSKEYKKANGFPSGAWAITDFEEIRDGVYS